MFGFQNKKIKKLKKYFIKEPSVVLAFVFGSFAKGFAHEDSDVDIALHLTGGKSDKIESEISRILQKDVDIVYFNEAPPSLIANILQTGMPLAVKDKKLYWEFYLNNTAEAEDFLQFAEDYWAIYQKAQSLLPAEKIRILQRIQFLHSELEEREEFARMTFEEYRDDRNKRRIIERWTENILNGTIDIAKMVLASEKKKMPKSYEDALYYFAGFLGFNKKEAERFSKFAKLRNILAHEYLDVLFARIQEFILAAPPFYEKMFKFLDEYLDKNKL